MAYGQLAASRCENNVGEAVTIVRLLAKIGQITHRAIEDIEKPIPEMDSFVRNATNSSISSFHITRPLLRCFEGRHIAQLYEVLFSADVSLNHLLSLLAIDAILSSRESADIRWIQTSVARWNGTVQPAVDELIVVTRCVLVLCQKGVDAAAKSLDPLEGSLRKLPTSMLGWHTYLGLCANEQREAACARATSNGVRIDSSAG
jgi:hypothetical protein